MTPDKWDYIRRMSAKHNARFIRCDGVIYEVSKTHRPTGPSPQWSIDEVQATDVEDFERLEQTAGHAK